MSKIINRAYENYLMREQKMNKKNSNMQRERKASTGLLAPRVVRKTDKPNVQANQHQAIFDAIEMIRNRGS